MLPIDFITLHNRIDFWLWFSISSTQESSVIFTYSGLKKIEEELQNLKVNKRREIAAKIKEAREQGDLSENAEYDAAKDEQRDIEARIEQLEAMLKNIEVVDEDEVDTGVVGIGCKVVV